MPVAGTQSVFTGISFSSSFTRCLWASCPLLPETWFVIAALSTYHLRLQPGHYGPLPSTGAASLAAKRWFPTCGRRFRLPTFRPGRIVCPYIEMAKGAGIYRPIMTNVRTVSMLTLTSTQCTSDIWPVCKDPGLLFYMTKFHTMG